MPWHYSKIGLPYEPGLVPATFQPSSDNMSFGARLSNWFTFVYMNTMYRLIAHHDDNASLRRRFGDDFPDVNELWKKVSLVFVNQHYSLTGAKHLSPNVIELGGIHIGKPNKLDPVNFLYYILDLDVKFFSSSITFLNLLILDEFFPQGITTISR